jgi:hypothetical protein
MSRAKLGAILVLVVGLGGCFGPPALRQAVLGYDETVTRLDQEILLLNIARLSDYAPPHFTVTSNIAATFNFQAGGGLGGSVYEGSGSDFLSLSLESTASENPTFSIVPMTGREFTERVLRPFSDGVFSFFAFQGVRIDLLSRLTAEGIEVWNVAGLPTGTYHNLVSKPEQFRVFRRLVMHLAALQTSQRLFITRLTYDEVVLDSVRDPPSTEDIVSGLQHGLSWTQNQDKRYRLTRRVAGRVLISDYDPFMLKDKQRQDLNERASLLPDNYVLIDVTDGRIGRRPSDPPEVGQMFVIQGALKLRSLFAVLDFVGKSIDKFPEFAVEPDPRSGRPSSDEDDRNPVHTLEVTVTNERPEGRGRWIEYNDQFYALGERKWDRQAFTILYELFQTTVTEVNKIGIPVTIAK